MEENKYVNVAFINQDKYGKITYRGDYLYKDQTKEGLCVGDYVIASSFLGDCDAQVTAINIPIEQVQEVNKNLYPGDFIKSIYRKINKPDYIV